MKVDTADADLVSVCSRCGDDFTQPDRPKPRALCDRCRRAGGYDHRDKATSQYLDELVDQVEASSPGWRDLPPGWTSGHGPAGCHRCGKATDCRDVLGLARHPECADTDGRTDR